MAGCGPFHFADGGAAYRRVMSRAAVEGASKMVVRAWEGFEGVLLTTAMPTRSVRLFARGSDVCRGRGATSWACEANLLRQLARKLDLEPTGFIRARWKHCLRNTRA